MKRLFNIVLIFSILFFLSACTSHQDINLIKKKANKGDMKFQYKLAKLYESYKNMLSAFELYLKSAKQN